MDISISDSHKAALSNAQHQLQWLHAEQTRLDIERQYVARQAQQTQADVVRFLQTNYGIDAAHQPFSLDMERGVIVVPDELQQAQPATAETATETAETADE